MYHCSLQTEGGMIVFTTQGNQWCTEAVNGKIPLDEKPGGNLVMFERNCLRLKKNPCFMKEWKFSFLTSKYIVKNKENEGRREREQLE